MLAEYKTTRTLVEKRMVRRWTNADGVEKMCGGPDLKQSQAYPRKFLGPLFLGALCVCFFWEGLFFGGPGMIGILVLFHIEVWSCSVCLQNTDCKAAIESS